MRYRVLGRTGLPVSVVGIGTWQLGGEWGKRFDQAEVDRMLASAQDLGVNLVDTAECYGEHLAEELIGRAIRGRRHHWIVATKFGHRYRGHLDRELAFDVESVRKSLERSLAALGTDHVDVYWFHSGTNEELESEGLWDFLQRQVQSGAIRFLGISLSGRSPERLRPQTSRASAVGAAAIQVVYNRLRPEAEAEVLPLCTEQRLGVVVRVPLAQGLLAGVHGTEATFDPSDLRSRWSRAYHQEMADRVRRIRESEIPPAVSPAHWAIAWSLAPEPVAASIVGCKSVAQVIANASTAESGLLADRHPLDVAASR